VMASVRGTAESDTKQASYVLTHYDTKCVAKVWR